MTADVSIAHRRRKDTCIHDQDGKPQTFEHTLEKERLLTFGVEGDDQ